MHKNVDKLTVLDGVVIAIGWCENANPEIVVDDQVLDQQLCHRFDRPDVEQFLGTVTGRRHGFKTVAVAEDLKDYSKIAVRFSDGSYLRAESKSPDDRINEVLDRFLTEIKYAPEDASLIELGSRARPGNSYRALFPSIINYTGVDLVDGENVDVVTDLHLLSDSVHTRYDFAFSVSVFEHLLMPWKAAIELNKVLVTGGLAYSQSHPAWPLHDEPWDYFRFSRDAWHGLFNVHTGFEILDSAYGIEGRVVPVVAESGALQDLDLRKTYLASACLVRKVSESLVDWNCDPTGLYSPDYSY